MRRPFPRTSGSPQATPIVETPAHHAPTLFWSLALLSEVVIGSVEPTMSCVSCETRCKYMKYFQFPKKKDKNLRLYGFLDCCIMLLVMIVRRNRGKGTG
jgi:hypothetical protein